MVPAVSASLRPDPRVAHLPTLRPTPCPQRSAISAEPMVLPFRPTRSHRRAAPAGARPPRSSRWVVLGKRGNKERAWR